jgi:Ca2+-binding RTX toxin-like protein
VVTSGQTLAAFSALQVADTVGAVETVTISLSYSYYSYYSPDADFGSISDPDGGGQYNPATHTFTETGLVTGDPTFATQLLNRLVYTAPAVQNGQSDVVTATVSMADNGNTPQTDPTSISIEDISAPLISGTVANAPVAGTAGGTISDSNAAPNDTVTISLLDSTGKISDMNGTLSGTGLTETAAGSGVYTLAAAGPAAVTAELDALTFTPATLPAGQTSVSTQFDLSVSDAGQTVTDDKTTVAESLPVPTGPADFAISDQTTGLVTLSGGETYTGPVSGITQDIILATSDNINVTADIPNVFIATGSGNDTINVSGANGKNILDSGTGSNFLTGGIGDDTFYLDDRNPDAPIFSTIVNFHAGDYATVWGVYASNFSVLELNNQGAPAILVSISSFLHRVKSRPASCWPATPVLI